MKGLLAITVLLCGCDAILNFDKLREGSDHRDGGTSDAAMNDTDASSAHDGGTVGCTPSSSGPNFDYSDDAGANGLFITTAYGASAFAIADVDGDHLPDLILVGNDQQLHLWQHTAARTITDTILASSVCESGNSNALVAADFDGDHILDLVVGCDDRGESSVQGLYFFRGVPGDTYFAPAVAFAHLPTNAEVAAAGDIDGDGLTDAVVSDYTSATGVSVYWGDNTGAFTTQQPIQIAIPGGSVVGGISVAPMGVPTDKTLDLVVNTLPGTGPGGALAVVRRVRGSGGRTFTAPAGPDLIPLTSAAMIRTVVGDLDGDGRPDLVAAENDSNLYYENGAADSSGATVFVAPATSIAVPHDPQVLTIGDLNCDGRADVALTHFRSLDDTDGDLYEVFKAGPTGALSKIGGEDEEADGQPSTGVVRFADIDNDGYMDIAMTLYGTYPAGDLRVLWGRP